MRKDRRPANRLSLRDLYLSTTPLHYRLKREELSMSVTLGAIAEGLDGERHGFQDVEIRGVTCDSRQVQPGHLFVAIPGGKADGRAFVQEAVRRGAAAIIAQGPVAEIPPVPTIVVGDARAALGDAASVFHGSPTRKLNVIGITGTKGKSTTAYLVRAIHETAGERVGILGTIQYALGGRVLQAPMTTPPADELQKYFAEMVAGGCRTAVMEVSSHALDQRRAQGIRFAAGVFTNLQHDHLDYHKTREEYRAAKARLFEQLSEKSVAAMNGDDPEFPFFAGRTCARVVPYGLDPRHPVSASIERMTFAGSRLRLSLGGVTVPVRTRLLGRHNAYNILAAAATAWGMGYDAEQIRGGLEAMAAVPGRLEPVEAGQGFAVLVDYAHTEESLRNVLTALRPLTSGRLIVVFGCGGNRDRAKRPRMGSAAEELADFAVLTSDNPRHEDPLVIMREVETGMRNPSRHLVEPDRRAAIRIAVSMARAGDTLLIAGKGHETVQVVGDDPRPFDDRIVARDVLGEFVRTKHE